MQIGKLFTNSFVGRECIKRYFMEDRHGKRIKGWFDHFHYNGKNEKGARAIEDFMFNHRDALWSKMRWRKHAVTPIIAAQRRSMFLELVS